MEEVCGKEKLANIGEREEGGSGGGKRVERVGKEDRWDATGNRQRKATIGRGEEGYRRGGWVRWEEERSYSLQSLVVDMVVTSQKSFMPDPSSFDMPDPNSFSSADPSSFTPTAGFNYSAQITGQLGHLKEDFALLLAVQIAFFLAFSMISFFSAISTILVSASSYTAKNLSLKELFSIIGGTWTRPLITTFYVSGLAIGYFVVVVMLAAPLLMYRNLATLSVAILLGTTSFTFYLYLFVAWALAIVVSVVEERCYGMDALGKAAALVKGKRLHGFLLNICFNLVVLIIFQGYKMILGNKVLVNPTIYGLVVLNVSSLVKIFLVVAYTVLYFQCKKDHGEEIELHGSLQYTKLATDMP
ncbi:hypothetical protein Pfo_003339 [Paulownia fortunei]|nr:hypothetical protein Pfo_003339 [Paulownia fortunei]